MAKEQVRNAIITKSAELACKVDKLNTPMHEFVTEYTEQFDEDSYCNYLRVWLGYMIEQGCKEAIDIMKNLIRYRMNAV